MTALTIFCAKYLFVFPAAMVAAALLKVPASRRRTLLLRGLLVGLFAVVMAKSGGLLYHENRPFVVNHTAPLIPHEPDNGFPSDHTLLSFACAFLILPFVPMAGGLAAIAALLIGLSRIRCELHSPLDIAASFVFAALACALAAALVRENPVRIGGSKPAAP